MSVGNGTISGFSGSGTTYTFTVTPTAAGSVTVDVAADGATDTSSVGNTAATQFTRTYDATRPSVVLSTPASASTNAVFTVTATFSESVTGFVSGDVTLANATISGFSGSGTTYTFTVTPTSQGTVTVDVAANVANDLAGNLNTAATQLSRTYDTTPPSVTLSSSAPNPTNAAFTVTATFSESVTGFTSGGVTVGNGSVSGLSGSGTTYTFTVTPTADSSVTVDLPANGASDTAGNGNTAAAQLTRTYDGTRPTISLSSSAPNPTNAAFTVTATLSETVTGFTSSDVTLGDAAISGFSGSGTTYTFTVTPTADGSVTVDVPANGASDAAGNGNTAATQLTRTYDATRPSVTLTTPASASTNAAFTVTATFSESVTGFVSGDVTLANATISGFSGSGATYTFTVTPTAEGSVTVNVAANVAADAATNGNTAATQLSRTYDVTRPTVTLSSSAPNPTNAAFTVTATFSESVTGLSLAGITVSNGTASALSGSGTTYTFTVTPTATGTVTVDLAAGSAADSAGNTNSAATQLTRTYDGTRPAVTLSTSTVNPTKASSFTVTATFSKSVTGLTLAGITVGNATKSSLAGSGTTYTFVVTPTADGTVTVDLAAGSAQDSVTNTNTAAGRLQVVSDRTAPHVSISGAPAGATTDKTATLGYSVDDSSATVTCKLDDVVVACSSAGTDFAGLALGNHTFTVTAVDAAGNVGTASKSWTVVAPGVPIVTFTTAPPSSTTDASETITFTSDTSGTVTCSLDGAPFGPCTSPVSLSGLAPGTHTFDVKVVSSAGVVGTARTTWTVLAPGTVIAPDIQVVMTASSHDVVAGQVFNTTVTATNVGNGSANDVSLTINLPPNTEFVSGDATLVAARRTAADRASFPCAITGLLITCKVGRMDPAAKYIVNLNLRALKKGSLEVLANASSSNAKPGHAQVWLNARPPKIEIAVELKTSRAFDHVREGEIFTATGIVTNVGGSTAEDVSVKLILPPIAKFVSGTSVRILGSSRSGASVKAWGCTLSVHFASGSAVLSPQARAILDATEMRIATHNLKTAVLTCNTDNVGSLAFNLALSQKRCASVANYLRRFGRIRHVSYKQAAVAYLKPVASNASAAGKAANRRVDVRVK